MKLLILVAAAIGLLALALAAAKKRPQSSTAEPAWPYRACSPLSDRELLMHRRLVQALPDHVELAQVALSRVIEVIGPDAAKAWWNRISQKSLDFVICDGAGRVLVIVELDDTTHQRAARQRADAVKDAALAAAGVRLVRVRDVPATAELADVLGLKRERGRLALSPPSIGQRT
jgi:Protein of unknown function (DUF2726)